jgi:acetyltransferase-like isoleucine patch superfamily enzyme
MIICKGRWFKFLWVLRALAYKPFFGSLCMPSYLGRPLYLSGQHRIFIGKRVRIFPHLRMECVGGGRIIVHDNVAIAQNVHITAGDSDLIIGCGTAILANSCLTSIEHHPDELNTAPTEWPLLGRPTSIGRFCLIGHGSIVLAGVTIGDNCVVGANSTVTRSFPDNCVIAGNPARLLRSRSESVSASSLSTP